MNCRAENSFHDTLYKRKHSCSRMLLQMKFFGSYMITKVMHKPTKFSFSLVWTANGIPAHWIRTLASLGSCDHVKINLNFNKILFMISMINVISNLVTPYKWRRMLTKRGSNSKFELPFMTMDFVVGGNGSADHRER